MGGNAKVVKKAVAQDMRKGSFFKSSFIAFRNSFEIEKKKYFFLLVIIKTGLVQKASNNENTT